MFWRVDLATIWQLTSAAKNVCFAQWGQFLKSFSVFPRTFCDCSLSLSTVLTQTLRVSTSNSIVASFLLKIIKKRYESSLPHFICYVLSIIFLPFELLLDFVFEHSTLRLLGLVGCFCCWFHLLSYCESYCANLCSVLLFLLVYILICYMGLVFSVFYSVCEFECLSLSEALDFYLILLCFYDAITCVLLSWGYF